MAAETVMDNGEGHGQSAASDPAGKSNGSSLVARKRGNVSERAFPAQSRTGIRVKGLRMLRLCRRRKNRDKCRQCEDEQWRGETARLRGGHWSLLRLKLHGHEWLDLQQVASCNELLTSGSCRSFHWPKKIFCLVWRHESGRSEKLRGCGSGIMGAVWLPSGLGLLFSYPSSCSPGADGRRSSALSRRIRGRRSR